MLLKVTARVQGVSRPGYLFRGTAVLFNIALLRVILFGTLTLLLLAPVGSANSQDRGNASDIQFESQDSDTLEVLLVKLLELDSAYDAALARIAVLEQEIQRQAEAGSVSLRSLGDEIVNLATSVSLQDSISLGIVAQLEAVQQQNAVLRRSISQQTDTFTFGLNQIGTRLDSLGVAVEDSIAVVDIRLANSFQTEQVQRRDQDSRISTFGGIAALLLLIGLTGVWYYSRKRVTSVGGSITQLHHEVDSHIQETSAEMLSQHVAALEELTNTLNIRPSQSELDHDLPLGLCNELNRIEKNLLAMDSGIRGHKQLRRCVRRAKENLKINDYQMTDLLGKPYNEGMLVEADFVQDESLEAGDQKITMIRQPEVRFQGKIIQNASVRVSVGM